MAGTYLKPFADSSYTNPEGTYGALNLVLKLPGTTAGIEEPLVTVGAPGNATFVFIRLLPDAKARIGIEFWGYFANESEPFSLPSKDGEITLKISFPGLYPKSGAPEWLLATEARQQRFVSHYSLAVDGVLKLQGEAPPKTTATAPIYIGTNPLGGSYVSGSFTGKVRKHWRDY